MEHAYSKRYTSQHFAAFTLTAMLLGAIYMLATERLNNLAAALIATKSAANEMTKTDSVQTALANDIRFHAEQSEWQLALLFFIKEKEMRIPVYAKMDEHKAALDRAIERITPLLTGANEKDALARLARQRAAFRDNLQETVDALELDDREKATRLLSTVTQENLKDIQGTVDQLINAQQATVTVREKTAEDRSAEAESTLANSRHMVIAASLGAAAIGLALGLLLMRNASRPA
jgi:hypothetical protein